MITVVCNRETLFVLPSSAAARAFLKRVRSKAPKSRVDVAAYSITTASASIRPIVRAYREALGLTTKRSRK